MKRLAFKPLLLSAAIAGALFVAPTTTQHLGGLLQAQEAGTPKKTRRTPALRSRVYDQLARAQSLADEGKIPDAISALDNVRAKSGSMNSYELAMMWNFYGFIHYNNEDYQSALEAFEQVVQQQPIPESFEQSTLYSLAQLHMQQGNYDKTIEYLERWEALQSGDVPVKNLVLKAQAMYQKKDFEAAAGYIDKAVELTEAEGAVPMENWYVLQRAVYYEMKQPKKVTEVLVKMVRHYNEPRYWVQLGGMYGEIGEEKKQLAVLESAYQQGYVTSGSDIFNLAQLYYYHQVPYKGAALMQQAMKEGVLERNLRNLKFLAQSWQLAQENEKAIPVMTAAAELSADGDLDAQLAQIYLNLEKWDDAIAAANTALEKGNVRNPGTAYLILGMSHFNKKQFVKALDFLAQAEAYDNAKAMARQWSKYVNSEKASFERLQAELSS